MANPFGGTLEVNQDHTNYASLQAAQIPRSTSLVKEVVSDANASITGSLAAYDSDGYLSASGSSVTIESTISSSVSMAGPCTIITFCRRVGTSVNDSVFKATNSSAGYVQVGHYHDAYVYRCGTNVTDGTNNWQPGHNMNYGDSNPRYLAIAVVNDPGASGGTRQRGRWRENTSLNASGGITATSSQSESTANLVTNNNNGQLNTVQAYFNTDVMWQGTFVYNAALSDGDIDAIFADPGAVVSQTGGGGGGVPKSTKLSLLGVG